MSSKPKITIEEDVHEHVLEGQPIRVKDYRLAFLVCFGLPTLISLGAALNYHGILSFIFAFVPLIGIGRLSYDGFIEN